MADSTHIAVPTHPIAPRLKNGPKIPHIGPHFDAYHSAHKETVGHESDKWWAKVSRQIASASGAQIGSDILYAESTRGSHLGSPLPHRTLWLLHKRRHQVVPRGWAECIVQLCRSLGVQGSREGELSLPIRRELCRPPIGAGSARGEHVWGDVQGAGRRESRSRHAQSDNVRSVCA